MTLLEKQGWTHQWCTPMNARIWPSKSRTTSSNIHTEAMWGTGCSPEDLLEAMNGREKWQERVGDIRAGGTTWWWWCIGKSSDFAVQTNMELMNLLAKLQWRSLYLHQVSLPFNKFVLLFCKCTSFNCPVSRAEYIMAKVLRRWWED